MEDDKKDYEETFYIIPRWIRKLPGMSLAKLDFIETMFQFFNKGKAVYLSNGAIQARTGIKSAGKINEYFTYFEANLVIKRIHNERGHRVGVEFIANKVQVQPILTKVTHTPLPGGIPPSPWRDTPLSLEGDQNIKKLNIKNINKTGGGFSAISENEKKVLELLRDKFQDKRISIKQARDVIKLHSTKVDIEWSINNYLYDLENTEEVIRNKIGVFTKRLEIYITNNSNNNYYPDNKTYTKNNEEKKKEEEVKNIPNSPIHSPIFNRGSSSKQKPLRKNEQVDLKSLITQAITRNKKTSE